MGKADTQLQITAYHEAGHTVAAHALGAPVGRVTIVPTDEYNGASLHGRIISRREIVAFEYGSISSFVGETVALRTVIIAFGGMVAQRRYSPHGLRRWHWSTDHEHIRDIVYRVVGDDATEAKHWYGRALRRTERIIEQRWREVDALALALLEKRTLSGAEATAAIQSPYAVPEVEQRRL